MKLLTFIILLFINFSATAQPDTNLSVISVEKVSTVYRGINNLIKIAVPGSKSFTATAFGNLTKKDSIGNYTWNVSTVAGTKAVIKIDAQMVDGSNLHEEKEYILLSLNKIKTILDGKNYIDYNLELTKQELIDATVGMKIDDCYIDNGIIPTTGFFIELSNKEFLIVEGNKMNSEAIKKIKTLRKGKTITIYADNDYELRPLPVKITLTD
ncbi:GldM family protein [Flavobacterium subsaxonicum]|uniref:Gliding motility-associated protein GldM second immunoglobulin-like domain-containing protein n=1 Tax=Flavobacterium subsaxonicum WB 4.1-42 = DSM 21790 TaxID=1121898 RepID=A0A0A2MQJ0_9FLAO|nr:GldM family protein [Flavobacterium subsaxonicum]KGO94589.1 hypothetical protein Q766_00235 [Flavobacterium subsaxonicum WB 4.1-42 = DSM 21790]